MTDRSKKVFQKWQEAKPTRSPVDGVELLREGNSNNFIAVKNQLYEKLQSEYGTMASFIETGERWEPEEPDADELNEKYAHVSAKIRETILTSRYTEYEKMLQKLDDIYANVFGIIKRVLCETVKDKVERSIGYQEAKENNDPVSLWQTVTRVIGMQAAVGDASDARQTVKLLYQAEKMSGHESLLSFYQRIRLRYENCLLLEVTDIPNQEGAARDFYSK